MPSSIAPIEQTRGYAVRPAAGLRFGNFEGVVHLPPLKHRSALGPHSYSTLNNQQIYRTVTEWVQSWQPWQQKVLLYSIANRLTSPQLEILATTLEPLRHRDPLIASRHKLLTQQSMPSVQSTPSLKKSPTKLSLKTTPNRSSLAATPRKQPQSSTPLDSPASVSQEGKKSEPSVQDSSKNEEVEAEMAEAEMSLDQYAEVVSSSVLVAVMGEIALASKIERIAKQELAEAAKNLESNKAADIDEDPPSDQVSAKVVGVTGNILREASKLSSTPGKEREATQNLPEPPASANCRPGILRSSSEKRAGRSRNASAQFLGGQILFTPQSRQSRGSERQRSGSSRYRYSAFASSAASTPDFFHREKISLLGPMKRTIRTGRVQRPVGLGHVPVPMQRFYKNRGWWPTDPPESMHLQEAQKRELASNFRDQLASFYEWLHQWEGHERLSLVKEVVKLCNGDVLEAVVIYIHQKLRDDRDINRLPDKVLLYVLSCLPPSDILTAAQVCRRWRYLCATDDLWIVKCLELGEEEGIDNMPQLIESANTGGMSVDWMLAYMELHTLVTTMREAEARSIAAEAELRSQRAQTDGGSKDYSKRFRIRRRRDKTGDADGETSTEYADKGKHIGVQKETGEATGDKESETDSGMSEEDLSALMGDDGQWLQPEHSGTCPGWAKSHRKPLRSSVQHRIQETVSENSTSDDKARESNASRGSKSVVKEEKEEEDIALDIHTDLSQSRDLLGKTVPAMSLEWRTPEHEDDFVRYPVYAGKVPAVQRVRKLQGHIGGIQCLQFDQRRLVTGGVDRSVRLWDVRSGRSVHKFYGHRGGVRCVKFDDDIMVTGSWDRVIFVWNMRHFTRAGLLHGHEDSVSCLQLVKHYIISGSHDHTVRVWSRPTYMCTQVLRGHSGPVLSLVADEEYVYSTATDMTIRMTDLLVGMCQRVFERANNSPIYCLSMQGSLLMGGDAEGKVYFWNTSSGEAEAAVRVHEAAVNTIHYYNGRFYTGSSDGTMTEYDLMTMTCLRVLRGHKGPVRAIQVSDRRFVSCSDDGCIRIWDLHTDRTTSLSSVF